jgi:hypothetical protein
MKAWAAAAMILGLAGGAEAGGFAPVTSVTSVTSVPASAVAPEPTPLEWLRQVGPQVGRNVTVEAGGALVPGIEWHRDIQVRVRTESGRSSRPPSRTRCRPRRWSAGAARSGAPRGAWSPTGRW